MSTQKHSHAQWGSRFGFILAAVGSAVGLGNIWKFPYMIGQSGGSAFVFTYLICLALIGFPILVAEWMIGRRGQSNPICAMSRVAKENNRSKAWAVVGFSGVLGAFLILAFYSVIGGWAINYIVKVANGTFANTNANDVGNIFTGMLGSAKELLVWHTAFMAATVAIVAIGVTGGLEKAAKLLMPLLGVCLIAMVGYGAVSGGFSDALNYLFAPNFKLIDSKVFLAALGHAFFTLSLGMGIMMSYGSYLGKDVDLLKTASIVVIMDTIIAILAGLAIFPIVFANQLDPSSGPGLIFVTLPIAFGNISGGLILGVLFFSLLTFAALTSAMSLLEPVVELLEEKTPLSRAASTILSGTTIWLIGIAALLSFNEWSNVLILGNTIFDFLDKLTAKFMLPLTGLGAIIFFGWFVKPAIIKEELNLQSNGYMLFSIITKFIAPIGVTIVFITSILDMYKITITDLWNLIF
ncbi:MAG: sodium-dependent transporter [Gammaproteobacteria bacterium]|nr:sodium-dependent transporter [Gammaproteobacteria bacterium]